MGNAKYHLVSCDKEKMSHAGTCPVTRRKFKKRLTVDRDTITDAHLHLDPAYDTDMVTAIRCKIYYKVTKAEIMYEDTGIWQPLSGTSYWKQYVYHLLHPAKMLDVGGDIMHGIFHDSHNEWDLPSYWRRENLTAAGEFDATILR